MPSKKNIYFYYPKEDVSTEQLDKLTQACKKNDFNIVSKDENADIVICIGDDGVYLQGVRHTGFRNDCLYVGISNENEAGLYSNFLLEEYQKLFDALNQNMFEVQDFPIIDVSINGAAPFYCLNEASVRSSIIKTIAIDVYIDNSHFERFRGDGLIVATPTGSAGYNKSTQGAILDPTIPCFQLTELASLNNNHYRTLGSSLVLAENKTLRLEVIQDGNDYPIIGLDNEAYSIRNIKDITLTMSGKSIQTLKLPGDTYWERLKRIFL